MLRLKRLILLPGLALLLGACATTSAPPPEARSPTDPWEPLNRQVYAFNRAADKAVLRPVARGYQAITPSPVRTGVTNFFDNLRSPVVILNLLLQGKPGDSLAQFERFFVNSVYGVGGIFDLADRADMPEHDADLGMTLATWGWEDSRYLMLPFAGPSTLRDGLGFYGDSFVNPVLDGVRKEGSYGVLALDVVQIRAGLLPLDERIEEAFDPYLFIRDGYLQRRNFQIFGEEAQIPDYEAFLEDDFDEEF
ncbi:MAG: VacJ family lipoprotein [Wenzhouxiangella sp.]|jgi:phospholipid-binding lipoprotein MlaA|nr:VacJ family lipoprotein [Wenzhouxiangella sp.]